jgi:amino acid transporter
MADSPSLNRTLSLPVLILYGLGTTIGAGIYALVGKVAGTAGMFAPVAFLVASSMAALTALSFCELSARYPRAGGEAVYVGEGLRSVRLATAVGVAVALASCISAATVARGFVGYMAGMLGGLLPLAPVVWIVLLMLVLGALAVWGIREAAWAAAAMTLIEVGGLVAVVVAGREQLVELPSRLPELLPPLAAAPWLGIGGASLICFYAFLGFEDMLNVAEEVKTVRKTLPRAILATLACTVVIYVAVSVVAVLAVEPSELAASEAPLAFLYEQLTGGSAFGLSVVGVLAMTNGALIQVIKASRLLYGLASQGQLPRVLARIDPRTHTPVVATVAVTLLSTLLASGFPIARLAEATSATTLAVFALANLALVRIKRREPRVEGAPCVPLPVPVAGFLVSTGFLVFELGYRLLG